MQFSLLYDGPLSSAGNRPKTKEKWEIRRQLDPQLRRLWEVNLDLKNLAQSGPVRVDGQYLTIKPHHTAMVSAPVSMVMRSTPLPYPLSPKPTPPEMVDLCATIKRAQRGFLPLVRDSLALVCGLRIQFHRQEARGSLYQGGDLDGRIKLLLDALSVPQHDNEIPAGAEGPDPLYCLLENDSLVTGLEVSTERLLSAHDRDENWVHLSIAVSVKVARPRPYNEIFLGD